MLHNLFRYTNLHTIPRETYKLRTLGPPTLFPNHIPATSNPISPLHKIIAHSHQNELRHSDEKRPRDICPSA
jgi:hypothetical protein